MVAVEYEGVTGLFDSNHAQHVRFSDRPLLDSHSRWRRVPRAPPSPAGDRQNMAQREERTHPDDDDACWSPLGAGLRIRSSQLSRSHRAGGCEQCVLPRQVCPLNYSCRKVWRFQIICCICPMCHRNFRSWLWIFLSEDGGKLCPVSWLLCGRLAHGPSPVTCDVSGFNLLRGLC